MQRKNFMAAIAKRKAQRALKPGEKLPDPDHIPDEIEGEQDTSHEVPVRWYQERIAELEADVKQHKIIALEAVQYATTLALAMLKKE